MPVQYKIHSLPTQEDCKVEFVYDKVALKLLRDQLFQAVMSWSRAGVSPPSSLRDLFIAAQAAMRSVEDLEEIGH